MTVLRSKACRHTGVQRRPEWAGEDTDVFLLAGIGFDRRLHITLGHGGGRGGRNIESARDAVLAEQNALRAAQNLDALQVEEEATRLLPAAPVNAVDIGAHRLLEPGVLAGEDAANSDVIANAGFGHAHVRDVAAERLHALDVRLEQSPPIDRDDRQRHVSEQRFALGRRDHDLIEKRGHFLGRRGPGSPNAGCHQHDLSHNAPSRA